MAHQSFIRFFLPNSSAENGNEIEIEKIPKTLKNLLHSPLLGDRVSDETAKWLHFN